MGGTDASRSTASPHSTTKQRKRSMTLWQRVSNDAGHLVSDVYSHWVLGDDTGQAKLLAVCMNTSDMGLSFLEIGGRAYVKRVVQGKGGHRAGIVPHDAVQLALLCPQEWEEKTAVQKCTRQEQQGSRTSYHQLVDMMQSHLSAEASNQTFLSPVNGRYVGPPIPSTILCAPILNLPDDDDDATVEAPPNMSRASSVVTYSTQGSNKQQQRTSQRIVLVLKRTRSRHSENPCVMLFRLDDECDFANRLVRKLAPTCDESIPWPKNKKLNSQQLRHHLSTQQQQQQQKSSNLIMGMDDVEAVTMRGMIQKAVGLAFVRASKVVMGVSLHGGSGIVISRLTDGTWSAPSAIGTWGLGLGVQFGLEVAEYIFILQTQEALQHFRNGGSYTLGGNMGVAVGGLGREAYGAASVGGGCGGMEQVQLPDDEYNDDADSRNDRNPRAAQNLGIAPIVAYAKSQGLYIGVSLEGSRIFTRNDVNSRTYKFSTGRDVSANDILSGKVPTPSEAEELYAALHSVEFAHEMSCLPRPPEILRKDAANSWNYERSTLAEMMKEDPRSTSMDSASSDHAFSFFSLLTEKENEDFASFEAQFKKFMYGGVSVQRLIPDAEGGSGRTVKERRTLWLMLPEVGSLRLGFVSKLSDEDGTVSNKNSTMRARRDDTSRISNFDGDLVTVGSEDVTLDSAIQTRVRRVFCCRDYIFAFCALTRILFSVQDGSTIGPIRNGNVKLSDKHSIALTDVSELTQMASARIRFSGDDKTQYLRVIQIQDVSGASLLFLANNFREAELLVCGLKLLLERETDRLGVRGGLPITALGGKNSEGAMSPSAARGFREIPSTAPQQSPNGRSIRTVESSVVADLESPSQLSDFSKTVRKKWSKQPGRNYMRGQAAAVESDGELSEHGVPRYVHGQQIVHEVVQNAHLPLPLPLCRVLLLDSTSPVIKQWEKERGDCNFEKTKWNFPPATPRELETHAAEHQLIASGSMCGAHRTTSFDRKRYGSIIRLSETHTVDADDPNTVCYAVTERNPRRGFSIKVKVVLRARSDDACCASIIAEVRPVGKDMSNQAAVHKAFQLVMEEISSRYGDQDKGLLSQFVSVIDNMAEGRAPLSQKHSPNRSFTRSDPSWEEKKSDQPSMSRKSGGTESGLVSFEDMLKTGRKSPDLPAHSSWVSAHRSLPTEPAAESIAKTKKTKVPKSDILPKKQPKEEQKEEEPLLIEVKPLPKIRLSLMPSPREEDEDNSSSTSPIPSKPTRRKKKKKKSKKSKSSRAAPIDTAEV